VKRRTLTVQCDRCGLEHTVERAGRYADQDFLELWHEHMELEAEYKAQRTALARAERDLSEALGDVERLRFLVERLQPPTVQEPELADAEDYQFS
jgi:hypothetical protein